jgi:hypothetical protein
MRMAKRSRSERVTSICAFRSEQTKLQGACTSLRPRSAVVRSWNGAAQMSFLAEEGVFLVYRQPSGVNV